MSQVYSNPKRESDPYSLPDVETFYVSQDDTEYVPFEIGWYWQFCFPGCLPDSDPVGPFDTEAEAIADAQGDTWHLDDGNRHFDDDLRREF